MNAIEQLRESKGAATEAVHWPGAGDDVRFIRLKEVLAICGMSRSSVYESIKKGAFPAPVKLWRSLVSVGQE
jgi:hypothetical protein